MKLRKARKYSRTALKKLLRKNIAERLDWRRMEVKDTRELGAAIRERRKKLGYTQSFLSEFSGFSASFISDTERGKETVELGKVIKLMQLLGMDMSIETRKEAQ